MKVLTVNAGSSSIKYSLYSGTTLLVKGLEERIGTRGGYKTHEQALRKILKELQQKRHIKDLKEITAVGHRVVHGGTLKHTTRITPSVLKRLRKVIELAPLHEPPEIKCILVCMKLLHAKHVAVFDTSFHSTMKDVQKLYGLPLSLSKKYNIQRYGFHGISHDYVSREAAKVLKKPLSSLKLITCHLGNGASVTAIKKGKSFDTSMGFTPVEGLMMGTRSGDIDAGILFFLMHHGYGKEKLYKLLNHQSGLQGISGKRDVRDIQKSKDAKSKLALDMFCYRVAKYIGAYMAGMNGCDGIVFTAGIGEHSSIVRKKVMDYFGYAGIKIDAGKNRKNTITISGKGSKIPVLVIPTNEELMMVKEVSTWI